MSIKALLGIIAAVIVLGGGAWYLSTTNGTNEGVMNEQGAAGTSEEVGSEGTTTFGEFLALGGSRECQVTVSMKEAPATGTVYVSGSDIRSDVVAKPANVAMEINAHMIRTGGYIYAWTDMYPQGMKMKESDTESESAANSGYDPSAEVSYTCKAWVPDASKFEVPASVTFTEFKGSAEGGGSVPMPN